MNREELMHRQSHYRTMRRLEPTAIGALVIASMKVRRRPALSGLTLVGLALGVLSASNAQTNGLAPSQVVILGTMHGSHRTSTNYSLEVLRKVIVAMKPAAILIEQPPDRDGHPTVREGRATNPGGSVESTIANLAADDLGVNVIPYDREGRDELYQQTGYFARQQAAHARLSKWLGAQKRDAPDSIAVLADRLQTEAEGKQDRLSRNGGPEIINSAAYDMVIVTKHGLFDIRPKLLMAAGERELAEEFLFINDEWLERNQIMTRHIRETARKFAGKRLVVLAGAEHRYILRELLAKAPEVELKEFYEMPEWTGATPPRLVASKRKGGDAASPGAEQQSGAPKGNEAAAAPVYTLVGIGAEFQSGYPDIKRLFPGSPAESSGQLHPGDRVVAVAQGDRAFVDTRNLSLPELVQTIRGKAGTTVRLQVLPAGAAPGATPKTVVLTRAQYKVN